MLAKRASRCSMSSGNSAKLRTPAASISAKTAGKSVMATEPPPAKTPAHNLPDDPYAALFAQGGTPREVMISPEQVVATLADLVEQPAVALRVPVGRAAERVLAARNAAPYDQPFVRA